MSEVRCGKLLLDDFILACLVEVLGVRAYHLCIDGAAVEAAEIGLEEGTEPRHVRLQQWQVTPAEAPFGQLQATLEGAAKIGEHGMQQGRRLVWRRMLEQLGDSRMHPRQQQRLDTRGGVLRRGAVECVEGVFH